jgi:uncharacterized membrane protein YjgN (DUF898 family)
LFRLRNSSYRGIRFGFDGTLAQSYWTFGLPLLLFVSPYIVLGTMAARGKFTVAPTPQLFLPLGLIFLATLALGPWLYLRVKRFQHGNARLGSTRFSFTATAAGVYGLTFAILGLGILVAFASVVLGFGAGFVGGLIAHYVPLAAIDTPVAAGAPAGQMVGVVAGVFVGYASLSCIYPVAGALRQNFVWGNTLLGAAPLQSRARVSRLMELHVVNAFLVIVTLGLYWPYAVVRTLRYQLGAISWSGDPAQVIADAADAGVTAVGEEAAEILGFDLAL